MQEERVITKKVIDIRFLDKATIVYHLWESACVSPYLMSWSGKIKLDMETIKNDIMIMSVSCSNLNFTIYHGRVLLVDITGDTMDVTNYDYYNNGMAENVITHMKLLELKNVIRYLCKV
jgi:hypothetical protein